MIPSSSASFGALAAAALSRDFVGRSVDMAVVGLGILGSIAVVVEREIAQGMIRDMALDVALAVALAVATVDMLVAGIVGTQVDELKAVFVVLAHHTI
jgi:hypothetical protein